MKWTSTSLSGLALATASTVTANCSKSAIQALLPSIATVDFALSQPGNSTFDVPKGDVAYPASPSGLQAHCAVKISVVNGTSKYGFGLFLPDVWNDRFLAVGNGGYAGGINWVDMGAGLGYGFAAMSTDTGHNSTSDDGSWGYKNEDALLDWGYRAMHGSVVLSKDLVTAFYGSKPAFSYYSGCSTGGRQGLRDIQLYPEDFDGVVAGAPAWWLSHMSPFVTKMGSINLPATSAHHIPPSLFPVINAEVLRQCDAADGVKDSILSDPLSCNLNIDLLLCTPSKNTSTCLTAPQLDTLSKIYSDYVDVNQSFVFPHLWPGSESGWFIFNGDEPASLGNDYMKYFMQKGPNWRWQDYTYSIVEEAEANDPGNASATDYDLSPFMARGGKLLHYHGMADSLIPTGSSLHLYSQILRTMAPQGVDLPSFYRFFLVPGMGHCSGSTNAPWYFGGNQASALNTNVSGVPGFRDAEHDVMLAIMRWVENGTAPEQIIGTKWEDEATQQGVLRQRPLCMYPQKQKYDGVGDADEVGSWSCE